MKKIIASALVCVFFSGIVFAGPYEELNNVLNSGISKSRAENYLDALAEDVGQAVSGGSFGAGASLGLFGMYVSLKVSGQQVSGSNKIIDEAGYDYLFYPVLQFEFGLPYRVDLIVRGTHFYDSTVLGGGIRWEAFQGKDLFIPTISLQSMYNHAQVDDDGNKFNLWNWKTSAVAYFGEVPFVKPYVFVGYDMTDLKLKSSDYSGLSSNVQGAGYGVGANASLGLINLSGAVSFYEGNPNFSINIFLGL